MTDCTSNAQHINSFDNENGDDDEDFDDSSYDSEISDDKTDTENELSDKEDGTDLFNDIMLVITFVCS